MISVLAAVGWKSLCLDRQEYVRAWTVFCFFDLFANLTLTLLSLPYCRFRGNLGTRSSLSKGPWSSPECAGFPYAFRTQVRVREEAAGT